jgi:hypothetical protein
MLSPFVGSIDDDCEQSMRTYSLRTPNTIEEGTIPAGG